MRMTAKADSEHFQSGADKYAAYLETPEGRLRCDLAFPNLQDFLPQPRTRLSLRALDLGCGTGVAAVRLARLGIHMTLLDSSPAMLDIAKRAAREAGVDGKIALKHGDAAQAANLFPIGSFEIVLCHNILEYVEDPCAVLSAAAQVLRRDSTAIGILSILVRNRAGEVLKAGTRQVIWRRRNATLRLSGMRISLRRTSAATYLGQPASHDERGVARSGCRARRSRHFGLLAAGGLPPRGVRADF
jgi:S-adenosylmethionine-dependent methyltransferase